MNVFRVIFIIILFTIFYKTSDATINISGQVSGKWTKSESPYYIDDDITIDSGDTLIIEPGVIIKFSPGKSLFINGTLKAIGLPEDRITFSSSQADQYWGIFLFHNLDASLSELDYCIIEKASQIRDLWEWGAISISGLRIHISNCIIQNNQNDGIWCDYKGSQPSGVQIRIMNNTIMENGEDGIFTVTEGDSVFQCQYNQILRNGRHGVQFWVANGVFTNNVVAGNSGHGIFFTNSTACLNLNTIANNSSMGIYCDWNSHPIIKNSIIYGNQEGSIELKQSEIEVTYTDVQDYWDGMGNITFPPRFVDPNADDYHLSPTSPCIDGGDPGDDFSNELEPNGSVLNMGAYGNTPEASQSITNAPEILVKTPKLFFGKSANDDSVNRELVVKNLGDYLLTIDKIEFATENFSADYSTINILPLDSITLSISFNPIGQNEIYSDTLKIYSNDLNENPTLVPLEGRTGTYVSGEVSGTWTVEHSPYFIQTNVVVPAGASLTIEPGVEVKLKPYSEWQNGALFKVYGTLIAVGLPEDSIYFTRMEDNGWWGAILFQDANNNCKMEYCSVSYGSGTQIGSYSDYAAVFCYNSTPAIKNSLFTHNIYGISIREYYGSNHAVIMNNQFAYNTESGIINEILNTVIKNNIMHHNGTGISCMERAVIANNTIVNNTTGIWLSGYSKPLVKNCIIWNNSTNIDDQNIDWAGAVEVKFCDVQGGWSGYGNIDMNPLFVNAALNDYHLLPFSPCIDGGDPVDDCIVEPVPNGGIVNMGAFGNTLEAAPSQDNTPEILIAQPMVDFGLLATNQQDSSLLTVRNIGANSLNIQNIVLDNSSFSCAREQAEIAPHDSINMWIYFRSQTDGDFLDTLRLYNNDFSEGISSVRLQAKTTSALFGNISGLFTKDHGPYIIGSDVTVPATATLTLEPGVRLEFMADASLFVYGTLNCVGTAGDSIIFTTRYNQQYWGGIYFGPESDNSKMQFTVVEYGKAYGKYLGSFFGTLVHLIACENSGPIFSHNTIRPIGVGGIVVLNANTEISDNKVLGGAYAGIRSCNSTISIIRNYIQGNANHGISADNGGNPIVENNILIDNYDGVYCSDTHVQIINNTIVNNFDSGIMCCGTFQLPIIKNNIIWGNERPFYLYGGAEWTEIDITFNDIEGGWDSEGNIDVDPDFINAEEGNYRLSESSACIDAGDPNQKYDDKDGTRNDIGATGGLNGYYLITSILDTAGIKNRLPKFFSLSQNYPNPFNPITKISYDLPLTSHVLLQVYDLLGREVVTLVNEKLNAGSHMTSWNATGFASGVYLYRLQAGNYSQTKKLILLR
jgi:hypothetical protein